MPSSSTCGMAAGKALSTTDSAANEGHAQLQELTRPAGRPFGVRCSVRAGRGNSGVPRPKESYHDAKGYSVPVVRRSGRTGSPVLRIVVAGLADRSGYALP